MKKYFLFFLICFSIKIFSQDIPQNISYTTIYDFMDELAGEGLIDLNSGIRPYSRKYIAEKLVEAKRADSLLSRRAKKDLEFFLQDYAIERDTLPKTWVHATDKKTWDISLWQPAFHFSNKWFKMRLTPLLGGEVIANKKGAIINRFYGADLQMTVDNHVSEYANLRDNSYYGKFLRTSMGMKPADAKLARGSYFNLLPGAEYKEANYGGDFSEMRGGIKAYCKYGSIGLIKDNLAWGESRHSSNILSGRVPSFPMLTLNLTPVKWVELNYIHGWLVSNVKDSTRYYVENLSNGTTEKEYRPYNKYIAANMLTVRPIKNLRISVGNSIIYSEVTPHAAYFIPIAFFKSLDHVQTKGLGVENQNSQIFAMISSRNIKHLHLYASIYFDEIQFKRLKMSEPQRNLYSYQVGATVTNFPLKNLYLNAEFTRSNIANYKHSIQSLTFASNSYYLGHYLGDNSQEIFVKLGYKPVRGLDISVSYTNARHYNDYNYDRNSIGRIIAKETYDQLTWQNDIINLTALYEIGNNVFAHFSMEYNNARGYDQSSRVGSESENCLTAQGFLDLYTPKFYQGKNLTFSLGLNIGF